MITQQQIDIAYNNLLVAQENYNYWLQKFQNEGVIDRILNGTKSKFEAARKALTAAENHYRELNGNAALETEPANYLPIVLVVVVGLIVVAIYLKFKKH